MNACTLDAPPCPASCLEHVDDQHTGTIIQTARACMPIESSAEQKDG